MSKEPGKAGLVGMEPCGRGMDERRSLGAGVGSGGPEFSSKEIGSFFSFVPLLSRSIGECVHLDGWTLWGSCSDVGKSEELSLCARRVCGCPSARGHTQKWAHAPGLHARGIRSPCSSPTPTQTRAHTLADTIPRPSQGQTPGHPGGDWKFLFGPGSTNTVWILCRQSPRQGGGAPWPMGWWDPHPTPPGSALPAAAPLP